VFDDIFIFVSAVKYGSFLTMAKHLGVAQSTISRRVKSLETTLGITLVKRNTQGIVLTSRGQLLFEKFKDCESDLTKLIKLVCNETESASGTLKLLLPPAFSQYAISPYLGELARENPNLNLECYYKYHNINMTKEDYDIAIISYLPDQATQKVRAIYTTKIIAVCTPGYIERYGLLSNIEDAGNHLILGKLFGSEAKIKYMHLHREADEESIQVPNSTRLMINNFTQGLAIVNSGTAICFVPEESVYDELKSGKLIRVVPDYYLGHMTFYMLRNIDINDLRYKIFDKFIQECIQRLKWKIC